MRAVADNRCLLWATIVLVASASANNTTLRIPNIQSAGRGYDILYGNPRPTGGNSDPGWRDAIFERDYSQDNVIPTAGVNYRVPEDFEVAGVESCERGFNFKKSSSSYDYKKELEIAASVEAGGWGASFTASANYKKVNSGSERSNMVIIEAKAQCAIWDVTVVSNASPRITDNFRQAVLNLPTQNDESEYMQFIKNFGTHFSKQVTLGALAGVQVFMSETSVKRLEKEGIDVQAEFKYAGAFASVSASGSYDQQRESQRKLEESMSNTEYYKMGGKYIDIEDTNAAENEAWAASARENPVPISFRLEQISSMLTAAVFAEDPNIELKRDNLILALSTYCATLQEAGQVSDCVTRDYPIKRAGSVGVPSQDKFSGEKEWNDMGRPMLARIDLQLFGGAIAGVVPRYHYGNEQRAVEGADIGILGLKYVSDPKTWEQANLYCGTVFPSRNGLSEGRLATPKDPTAALRVENMYYGVEVVHPPNQLIYECGDNYPRPNCGDQQLYIMTDEIKANYGGCAQARVVTYDCAPREIWLGAYLDASNIPDDYQWVSGAPLVYHNYAHPTNYPLEQSLGVALRSKLNQNEFRPSYGPGGFLSTPSYWTLHNPDEQKPFMCEELHPTRSIELDVGEFVTKVEVCTFNVTRDQVAISSMTFTTSKDHREPEVVKADADRDQSNDTCTTFDVSERTGLLYFAGSRVPDTQHLQSLEFFSFQGEVQDYGDIPGLEEVIARGDTGRGVTSGAKHAAGNVAITTVSFLMLWLWQ